MSLISVVGFLPFPDPGGIMIIDLFFMLLDKYANLCVTQMEVCGHGKQPEETETSIHSPAEI